MGSKMIAEFINLGANRKEAAIALQVYIELCEVKRYYNVEYKFNNTINKVYMTAKRTASEGISVFVPIATTDDLSFDKMHELLTIAFEIDLKCVYLVMCTPDSLCIYYQITDGIGDPPPTVPSISIESKQNKIDKELIKNRLVIEEAAINNVAISILPENTK